MIPRRTLLALTAAAAAALTSGAGTAAAPAPAPAPAAAAAAQESAPARAPEAAAAPAADPDPSRYDTDAALAQHAEDVVDYTLRASLDPDAHTVHGEGTITWRNTSTLPTRELWVHLYLNAFKNQRSTWLRAPITGFRGVEPLRDWGYVDVKRFALHEENGGTSDLWAGVELHRPGDEDETDARVTLPRDVAPGEKIQIDMVWDDKLPQVVERTGYWSRFHMVGQWFPKIARLERDGRWAHFPFQHLAEFYADYGTYDVTLDVPQGFLIGATGPAIDTRVEGGRRVERHVQGDVHDFAWTAWDQWQVDKETIDGVSVSVLYPPSFKVVAQRELRAMRFSLPHFGARYGRYPYEVLTLVHPPMRASEAGGMEYPTLITTGGRWYGPPDVYLTEGTAVHELGHEWFYGLVATNEYDWPFLDEGLNSYAEHLAMAEYKGAGSGSAALGLLVGSAELQAVAANMAEHDAPVAQPAASFERGFDVSALVYGRTSAILETLRRTYGEDLVTRAMGRYARRYRFQHPGPEELLATFREVMGEKVEKTLRAALFDRGWVDYAVEEISGGAAREPAGIFERDGKRETVAAGQSAPGYDGSVLVMRHGTLAFPVVIDLMRADGTRERVHWDGESSSIRLPYHGDVALRSAVVDPDKQVLLDDDRTNDFATVRSEPRAGAPRTFERLMYWVQLVMQAVLP